MSGRAYVSFAEVKQRISIVDALEVLGLADRFRKEGKTYVGVCPLPLHQHGPSPNASQFKITVRDGESVFYCFGDCQRGGDVIEFVKLMTGLDNRHVRFWFAEHFGDRLALKRGRGQRAKTSNTTSQKKEARETRGPTAPQRADVKVTTTTVPTEAAEYKPIRFRLQVDPAAPYLRERGLTDETIARYGLGVAQRGMLKGYVAIPVWESPPGQFPYGYLGRWAGENYDDEAGKPRYKWPANFPKQRFLFGLNEALDGTDGQPIVVTEGVFGALHCVQCGFPASVATFGASLSREQAKLLIATGRPVVLMFDGGQPGRRAMKRAALRLAPHTFVRVVRLKEGQQPDDLSPEETRRVLSMTV
ncbi:MAG: toprim domain-containing protein [Planctomycetota bacterium]|mgnify:CR=1 FL=1|nr:MAG: toprim domain-containing protein [Planctomycetota bacterium]REK20285.1 MAG: toprim domain-containing protein [Planctomycetota bacterium]REK34714.1 MAG: toprim domain-containing protein [Planctomycetota bacterium]